MGVRSITNDEVITGFSDIALGCLKKGCGPMKLLQKRNVRDNAKFDAIIYTSNPFLYCQLILSKYNIQNSFDAQYIRDYNKEAKKIGIPAFLDDDYLLFIVSLICTFLILTPLSKESCGSVSLDKHTKS